MAANDTASHLPLAIIGMACRLPVADNLDQYWDLIAEGRSAIGPLSADLLDPETEYDPNAGAAGKTYTQLGGLVSRLETAAQCSGASDRSHRLMCDVAAQACRHADMDPFNLPIRNTGVFIGYDWGSRDAGDAQCAAAAPLLAELLYGTQPFGKLDPDKQRAVADQFVAALHRAFPSAEGGNVA